MKKTIKSVLVGALVALLGSSAWAAANVEDITIVVNESAIRTMTVAANGAWSRTASGDGDICAETGFSTGSARYKKLTFTGKKAGKTTWAYSCDSDTWTFNINVIAKKDDVNMDEIRLKAGESASLTNESGQVISFASLTTSPSSTDAGVAKVVPDANGNACVTNEVHDGTAEVVVETATKCYIYPVRCMTIGIGKTVKAASDTDPDNKSNATIRVTTHVLYGVNATPTNSILFVGSLCKNHDLAEGLTKEALEALVKKGRVDYYLYQNPSTTGLSEGTTPVQSGSLTMNATVPTITNPNGGGHRNLVAYLTLLDSKLAKTTRQRTYDYVVLEFDGNRLASNLSDANAADYAGLAKRVAEKLAWYYENKRVIWLVDPAPGSGGPPANTPENKNDPYYNQNPSQYYRPSTFYYSDGDRNLNPSNLEAWKLLVALLDPKKYLANEALSETLTYSSKTYYVATRNDLQAFYSESEKVTDLLDKNVKLAEYDTELVDTVYGVNQSLGIVPTGDDEKEVHFYTWVGPEKPEKLAEMRGLDSIADLPNMDDKTTSNCWAEESDASFGYSPTNGYQIIANVSNITMETWNKVEIGIVDNGNFLQTCIAAGRYKTDKDGKYLLDPNDGKANVTLYSIEGGERIEASADAGATLIPWKFDLIPLTIYVKDKDDVTYGDDVPTASFEFKKSSEWDCPEQIDESKIDGLHTVTFGTDYTKGSPVGSGYTINTNSTGLSSTYYAITVVPGKLTVKPATIKPVKPGEEPTDPTKPYTAAPCIVKTYDGEGTNITAEVFNVDDTTDVPTFKYSLSENGPFKEWSEISIVNVTNENGVVMSNKVWYTVTTKTADDDVNYFAATNFAYVKINPRPVAVTAESDCKPYDGYLLENGDFFTSPKPATATEGFVGEEGIESVEMTDDSSITDVGKTNNVIKTINWKDNTRAENYQVTTNKGLLTVWQSDMTATVLDAEKTYDGEPTNIVVTPSIDNFNIYYAPDGKNVDDLPRVTTAKGKMLLGGGRVMPEDLPEGLKWGSANVNKTYTDACVSNKVWFKIEDVKQNYSNYYGYGYVTIEPREVELRFPKAEKPYDGNGNYPDLVTNLVGEADNMVGDEWFDCTGSGVFTNVNVGAGESYFVLNSVKLDAGVNTFFRNYTIKYWADGAYNELAIGSDKDRATSVTIDTTALPNGTDGEITIVPMVIGGVTQPGEPGKQIPVAPEDPNTWTNGAKSVVKEYDAKKTNIVVKVTEPAAAPVYYCYDNGGKPDGDWKTYAEFDGYTDVTNVAPVWYKVEYPNYLPVTNRAFVTITARQIQGKETKNEPWAQATSVECFIDEIVPLGGTTNIIVTYDGFFGTDEPKLEFTTKDGWSEIGVYTNWCTVSCEPNYLPTNLMATVKIKEREGDVDGDTEPENAEEIAEEMKDVAKAAGEIIRETTGEDPIYVEVRLVMNSTNSLPQAEQERTAQDAKKLEEKFGKDYSDYENVKGECVDIKLELTTDPDRVDWTNIGSNNDVMVDIELTPDCALDEIVAIYRCHYSGSTVSYNKIVESASKPSKTSTEERWWRNRSKGVVHLHVKKFSLFEIFTGDKVTPPAPVNPCGRKDPVNEGANVYQLQMQLRSTWGIPCSSAVTAELCGRSNPGVSSVIRIPASFVVNAWLYNCTNACWTLENSSIVAWEQNRAKFFSQPAITWDLLNIIGVSADQSETAFTFTGKIDDYSNGASATPLGADWSVTCAGQGTFSKSAGKYTFFSGYCAGDVSASYCIQGKICEASKVATCGSSLTTCPTGVAPSAVYGRWALRYNEQASLQYWRDGTFSIPANIRR